MENPNLETAIADLCGAIRSITLGSVEYTIIDAAVRELITNWNSHNHDDPINEVEELINWENAKSF